MTSTSGMVSFTQLAFNKFSIRHKDDLMNQIDRCSKRITHFQNRIEIMNKISMDFRFIWRFLQGKNESLMTIVNENLERESQLFN